MSTPALVNIVTKNCRVRGNVHSTEVFMEMSELVNIGTSLLLL